MKSGPGPWVIIRDDVMQGKPPMELMGGRGETVVHFPLDIKETDARLIAAAPEMLSLLERRLNRCVDEGCISTASVCEDCRATQQLIAKIEGGK